MPTYEYRCQACGHEVEALQSMKDAPLSDCPACSSPSLKRQISRGTGMIFKGSGFYETDYRRKTGVRESAEAPSVEKTVQEAKPAGCGGGCACHGGS
jgi:putative FmdB family regulatory protein